MSIATLDGNTVTKAKLQIPAWGLWWLDVTLAEEITIEKGARVPFVLADIEASGTVINGGPFNGSAAYRVAGGAGGWGKTLDRKGYSNDAGVKAGNVLRDAAESAGETIGTNLTRRLGPHYVRQQAPAARVLNSLSPKSWYVDLAGVTHTGARDTTEYTGDGSRSDTDPSAQVLEIATEEIATLLPGVTIDGSEPATDIEHVLDAQKLRTRVFTGPRASRRLDAFARMFESFDPNRKYRGVHEFRVVQQSGDRLSLQPVRTANGMPDLSNVPMRPGTSGTKNMVLLGSLVLVSFIDADPSRPCVVAFDAPDAPGWMPLTIELGGPSPLGVARLTDTVQAGAFAGVITGASARVKAAL